MFAVLRHEGQGIGRLDRLAKANCNPLYVDFAKPSILMTFQTLPPYGYSGLMGWAVPWQASMSGMDIWMQGGWLDSSSKAFSLTSAARVTFPTRLPPDKLHEVKAVYDYRSATNQTGFGPIQSGMPFVRYAIK